ncbi:MAG TPA: Hpt domain-containing protein, partial [Kofleriaceae bacterium]|nr:Hpt domain-containing protein [Kofleriaceae bacterium]
MSTPSYVTTFVHEVEELLERVEAAILALESTPGDAELINQLFRAFHTLKGSAGVAGVSSIAAFTHHVETAMDRVRSGAITLTPALVSAVLGSKDYVAALLEAELGGPPCDATVGERIVAQLAQLTAGGEAARPAEATPAAAPELRIDYLVAFQPGADFATIDVDRDAIVAALGELGACQVLAEWSFLVTTSRGSDAIRDVFIFIEGAGKLSIDRGLSEFMDDEPAPAPEPAAAVIATAPVASEPAARR